MPIETESLQRAAELTGQGDFDRALAQLKAILEQVPQSVLALGMQAAIHAQLGMRERAAAGYQQVLDIDAANPLARAQLALLQLHAGRPAQALDVLRPALDKPGDHHMQYLAGLAVLELGRVEDARRHFELADRGMPRDDPARPALAQALARCERGRP
jgi:tetratricopeptide (TPR) repeat protein